MEKKYKASCHCGAVEFEVDVDLLNGTSRCNCSICSKTRMWKSSMLALSKVRLKKGEAELSSYHFKDSPHPIEYHFCKTCGVKVFARGKHKGSDFIVVSIAAIDTATDAELGDAIITYQDGRHDAFDKEPKIKRYL